LFLKVKNLPAFGSGGADERVYMRPPYISKRRFLVLISFILVAI